MRKVRNMRPKKQKLVMRVFTLVSIRWMFLNIINQVNQYITLLSRVAKSTETVMIAKLRQLRLKLERLLILPAL